MTGPHPASWPIAVLLIGYPVWWMLGFGGLAVIVLAPPMAVVLWRRRPVRVPKGFGIWLLLLAGYLVSALMLGEMPPDTYGEFGAGRIIGYLMRLALYVSMTIMVLYLGSLTEHELPQLRLVRMLGALFVTTVAGGLLGVFAPQVQFTSPVERLLPGWISGNSFVQNLIHPTAAQMQKVLGHASPRPEAPFEWANAWGSNLSVLLVWFVVGWWVYGGPHRRLAALVLLALASIPVVYSLNRGLWIGLGVAAAYLILRTSARRRLVMCAAVAAGALAFVLSPLQPLVAQRLDNPHSNDIRAFTVSSTIAAAGTSPFIGYGNNRSARGNYRTITTGKSDWCDTCGHPPLGSDGQLWHLMITQGFVGAALYVAFFAGAVRRHWSDRSPIGAAGVLVMILTLLYMFVYDGLVTPLILYLISFALLWRNTMARGATE
ncbi:O-antigen ligase family protein [Planomonospora sp. ID91781]|uniref:O-antigen ligase family protein n=1 Tax=Planomonospora sp. ID91781 TaxID=2738135 RepID=UPI0018C3BD05|nr:O-antigen ligase family protein [Planomonospora sp. ID91781]MBG0819252.1 O-antigen ligase family protein [Planomonospora sp. ID91781]